MRSNRVLRKASYGDGRRNHKGFAYNARVLGISPPYTQENLDAVKEYLTKPRIALTANTVTSQLFSTPATIRPDGSMVVYSETGKYVNSIPVSDVMTGDLSEHPNELFVAVDENGNLVALPFKVKENGKNTISQSYMASSNSPNFVAVLDEPFYAMRNRVFVHNHPNGAPFSFDDITLAQEGSFRGIEARANRRAFWGIAQEISQNRTAIIQGLRAILAKREQAGMADSNYRAMLQTMIDTVSRIEYNSSQPPVTYQATPKTSWNDMRSYRNEHNFNHIDFITGFKQQPGLQELSSNARVFISNHAMMASLANRAGFNYSLIGTNL
jgi:hypothetical protein